MPIKMNFHSVNGKTSKKIYRTFDDLKRISLKIGTEQAENVNNWVDLYQSKQFLDNDIIALST